jgi:hypothetical protein
VGRHNRPLGSSQATRFTGSCPQLFPAAARRAGLLPAISGEECARSRVRPHAPSLSLLRASRQDDLSRSRHVQARGTRSPGNRLRTVVWSVAASAVNKRGNHGRSCRAVAAGDQAVSDDPLPVDELQIDRCRVGAVRADEVDVCPTVGTGKSTVILNGNSSSALPAHDQTCLIGSQAVDRDRRGR